MGPSRENLILLHDMKTTNAPTRPRIHAVPKQQNQPTKHITDNENQVPSEIKLLKRTKVCYCFNSKGDKFNVNCKKDKMSDSILRAIQFVGLPRIL